MRKVSAPRRAPSVFRAGVLAAVAACAAAYAQAPPAAMFTDHDNDLVSLSQVLGAAHYIRRLCYGRADQRWRDQMMKLMDLEGPPGAPQRKMMSDAFNDGYRAQQIRFPVCTPEAQGYESELNAKGARLANALAARYRD